MTPVTKIDPYMSVAGRKKFAHQLSDALKPIGRTNEHFGNDDYHKGDGYTGTNTHEGLRQGLKENNVKEDTWTGGTH